MTLLKDIMISEKTALSASNKEKKNKYKKLNKQFHLDKSTLERMLSSYIDGEMKEFLTSTGRSDKMEDIINSIKKTLRHF